MESISPKLVQSWQSPRTLTRTWAECLDQWQSQLPIIGASAVLICACLAEAFNPNTAGLGVATASWGFLTLAHWSRNSAPPAWRSMLALAPFLTLAVLIISGAASQSAHYEGVKRVAELSGLVALGMALHLTIRRRSVLRRLLVVTCGLAIACVGLVSVAHIVTMTSDQSLIERFRSQPDLLALSVLSLCLAVGLVGQRKDRQWSRRTWLAFGCLPLTLPLVLSVSGLALTALVIAIAVGRVLVPSHLWRHPHARWLAPVIVTAVLVIIVTCSWLNANPETWRATWEHPLLGNGVSSGAVAATSGGWETVLHEFGVGGLLLLLATPWLYLRLTNPSPKLKPQALRDWCWIGCAMMAIMAVWTSPFDHHGVAVLTVILFVGGHWCHKTASPKHKSTHAETSPPPTGTPNTARVAVEGATAAPLLPPQVVREAVEKPAAFMEFGEEPQSNHRPQIWRQRHRRLRAAVAT